jgi:nicotinamide-nucleotide amidase
VKIEILAIGNEFVSAAHQENGFLWIAEELRKRGFVVSAIILLAENLGSIKNALIQLSRSPGVKIILDGSGSISRDRISENPASRQEFSFLPYLFQLIFEDPEKEPTKFNPQKIKIIKNPRARLRGLMIIRNGLTFIFLPNGGREQKILFHENVLPILEEIRRNSKRSGCLFFRTFGAPTSLLIEKLKRIKAEEFNGSFDLWLQFPESIVMISVQGRSQREVKSHLVSLSHLIYESIGDFVLSDDGRPMEEVVGDLLQMKGFTLAIAESCSGGLLGHKFTNVPGSSKYFLSGIIAYSNEAKMKLLEVPRESLARFGAVSAPVARKMAQGVRKISRSTLGLSITGIAGPEGGTAQKPVGTVFIGLSTPKGTWAKKLQLKGNREQIKTLSAYSAMDFLRRYLKNLS